MAYEQPIAYSGRDEERCQQEMVVTLVEQRCVMAVVQVVLGVVSLSLQDADPAPATWVKAFNQGLEAFFTVERIRDTVIIVVAVGMYLWLAGYARERMIMTPMRVVIAQELRAMMQQEAIPSLPFARSLRTTKSRDTRSGEGAPRRDESQALDESASGLDKPLESDERSSLPELVMALESGSGSRKDLDCLTYQGLHELGRLRSQLREKELAALDSPALLFDAWGLKESMRPPIDGLLAKSSLSEDEQRSLRHALVVLSREQAKTTWDAARMMIRRMRKAQVLGTAGLLLIVLLVTLFGNPALVAFGVLGAVISRTIAFFGDATDDAQKYHWVTLFLVPVVGGLSAFAGVLLIDAARTWGLLGTTFTGVDFGGDHANAPTMAAAFLFGFVERLLDRVVSKQADGLAPIMANDPSVSGTAKPDGAPVAGAEVAGANNKEAEAQSGKTANSFVDEPAPSDKALPKPRPEPEPPP